MAKIRSISGALVAILAVLSASESLGQRIQFATPVQAEAPSSGTLPYTVAPPTATYTPPAASAPISIPPPSAVSGYAAPGTAAPGGVVYAPAPAGAAGGAMGPGAGAFGPAPMATLNGSIQQPPGWDPYAPPAAGPATTPIMSQDPYLAPGQFGWPSATISQMHRLLQEVRVDVDWFAGSGSTKPKELGITDVDLSATFALPLFGSQQSPLLITPGFAAHWFNGPVTTAETGFADLPPVTFDAYLQTDWNPQISPALGAETSFRIGVFSDFKKFEWDSLRYIAKGVGVITMSPSFKLKAGVWYIDRVRYKLLPAGGIVWSPNPDVRFDILFPNPRFTRRLATTGNTEWWWFVSGEYGGGSWTVVRHTPILPDSPIDQVDYNDIEVALGVEFKRLAGLGMNGAFAVGYSFDRELYYRGKNPQSVSFSDTVFLRAGISY